MMDFTKIESPVLFRGDERIAYRDPAAFFNAGTFYLYLTVGTTGQDGLVYWQTAWSKSCNLIDWTVPECFTPKDRAKNFSSPGNVIEKDDEFILSIQTIPTPLREDKHGNASSRIWTMRSRDLERWGEAELLRVKGPHVPQEEMGRMIDPYLVQDKDDPGKWWCFYKQNGISCSYSTDLEHWTFSHICADKGENPCVILDHNEYVLFWSRPEVPVVLRSSNLKDWRDCGPLPLGKKEWDWAAGRLSAPCVLDLRKDPSVGKAIMFFHGSRYPEWDSRGGFSNWVSLGIAWSDDLVEWSWPGKKKEPHT